MADAKCTFCPPDLSLLKASLGYFDSELPPALEKYLKDLLNYADQRLREDCGIELIPGDISDDQLKAMYADWIYRNRATGAGKTEMLKDAIRNRQVGSALRAGTEGSGDL